jgi:CheY-like chemotaxis protein
MRVLNLEDDSMKHSAIERALRSCGISDIAWARNFEDGMELLEEPCDLIITDMQFPMRKGENDNPDAGEKVIEQVKARGLEIPVIICSSGRYRIPEAYGCIWYSPRSEWEQELRELVQRLQK